MLTLLEETYSLRRAHKQASLHVPSLHNGMHCSAAAFLGFVDLFCDTLLHCCEAKACMHSWALHADH